MSLPMRVTFLPKRCLFVTQEKTKTKTKTKAKTQTKTKKKWEYPDVKSIATLYERLVTAA